MGAQWVSACACFRRGPHQLAYSHRIRSDPQAPRPRLRVSIGTICTTFARLDQCYCLPRTPSGTRVSARKKRADAIYASSIDRGQGALRGTDRAKPPHGQPPTANADGYAVAGRLDARNCPAVPGRRQDVLESGSVAVNLIGLALSFTRSAQGVFIYPVGRRGRGDTSHSRRNRHRGFAEMSV